ncbi:hypothetical protein ACE1CI_02310 [Aerosakkonemataceae cyanobacterium BLCC-F50]|uniref:Uncharacterized protein n=1 Tax=Floridaenema flaviceps BLCC-F50 TaxID=3153642 RepID=A0ABV4XJM1_9CYAN
MVKENEFEELINKIIIDAILLRRLSDKVYKLMLEDLRNQRDRAGHFRR